MASLAKRYLWGAATDQILAEETAGGATVWDLADRLGTVRDQVDNAGNYLANSHADFGAAAPRVVIRFGANANQQRHAWRHFLEAGLDNGAVQAAIETDIAANANAFGGGLTIRAIVDGGRKIF